MVHLTRNVIYKWYKQYAIDNLTYQTNQFILLSYCIMVAPFTLFILIHCKEKWPNYMNMLISPVAQVR